MHRFTILLAKTKCQQEREDANAKSDKGRVGHFTPKCDKKGDYSAVQVHGSTGFSWCVNIKTGEKISGTDTRGTANCSIHMDGKFCIVKILCIVFIIEINNF